MRWNCLRWGAGVLPATLRSAVRWFGEALDRDPTLAENRQTQLAYNAACVAALAGSGQGVDDLPPDEMTETKLRGQALAWLQAELDRWTQLVESAKPEQCQLVVRTLAHWQTDSDLSGVRGDAIEKLPDSEREAWRALWSAVKTIRMKAADNSSGQ